MPTSSTSFPVEPLRARISDADDRIRLYHWMRPQQGIALRIRIGRRWINMLWGLPREQEATSLSVIATRS
jgi:sulfoxide reductase catalytic subunit YedY